MGTARYKYYLILMGMYGLQKMRERSDSKAWVAFVIRWLILSSSERVEVIMLPR